ncbi:MULTISPECIES: hypothetical protein [Vibrio harveyi group]|uniref:hypothetical protein n=1 Tax=Vibrio harveyi group TaxID=717610 RepID=UPI0011241FEB|nr:MULTISPECIES: hypothetical protein [Vibrio harveyi group]EMD1213005.1 hypothetical protein [Vibrio alginolyticus]KAB2116600.1 hypothetical protein F6475_00135 [Vibrio alginolyticus]TOP83797.1 hypothetical protein CGH08_21010 [Vibrio parahaemolyticus]TOQ29807.1 hypothetical protein CGG99_08835 [Vibrio parahaemolyticus]HCG5104948.1 hypothetical protein [Vibrio parahaemolyticus]
MSEQNQNQQSQGLSAGAYIASDGLLRFSPQFYVTLARHCVDRARNQFFEELDQPKAKVKLKFADIHKGSKTLLPAGYLSFHLNSFFDYLAGDAFAQRLVEQCEQDIALKVVMKPMKALVNENLDRVLRAFRVTFLEVVEEIINKQDEHINAEEHGNNLVEQDVTVKNRAWLVAALENATLDVKQVDPEEEQEEAEAESEE